MNRLVLAALSLALATPVLADEIQGIDALAPELRPFVEAGTKPIWLSKADLDRDGDEDFVLVLERTAPEDEFDDDQRPLLVLVRDAEGLRIAKRNDRVVMCSKCGGVMGDPFVGIEAKSGTFTVSHFGGSRERWGVGYRFDYSRRDKTWQLVEVTTLEFDAMNYEGPNSEHDARFVPPRDFGKIDIADFDPNDWKGRGER